MFDSARPIMTALSYGWIAIAKGLTWWVQVNFCPQSWLYKTEKWFCAYKINPYSHTRLGTACIYPHDQWLHARLYMLTWTVLTWTVLTWTVLTWTVLTWTVLTWTVLTWTVLTRSCMHIHIQNTFIYTYKTENCMHMHMSTWLVAACIFVWQIHMLQDFDSCIFSHKLSVLRAPTWAHTDAQRHGISHMKYGHFSAYSWLECSFTFDHGEQSMPQHGSRRFCMWLKFIFIQCAPNNAKHSHVKHLLHWNFRFHFL